MLRNIGQLLLVFTFIIPFYAGAQPEHSLAPVTSSSWMNVGTPDFSEGYAIFTDIEFSAAGQPYVSYQDDAHASKASVKRFDGTNWVYVGSAGFSAYYANALNLAINPVSDQPYVVYQMGVYPYKATVMKFDGVAWSTVGPEGFTPDKADDPRIAFSPSGEPFVAFADYAINWRTSVMKYNGSAWVYVGNPGISPSGSLWDDLVISPSGVPYVTFPDYPNNFRACVMKYDGTNWVYVGIPDFTIGRAAIISLVFNPYDGEPYLAFSDQTVGYNSSVMKFDGSNWVYVGNPGFTTGAATDGELKINPVDQQPFLAYTDVSLGYKAVVRRFNNPSWDSVGVQGFSPGMMQGISLAFNTAGVPYVAFTDLQDTGKATVMKYDSLCLVGPAGPISGPGQICAGDSNVLYSVAPISGATFYTWVVPAGVVITSGSGTDSITVKFGTNAVSGLVTVNGTSPNCDGLSSQLQVVVNPLPVPTLTGPQHICLDIPGNLYSTDTGMNGYTWIVSSGGMITSGGSTSDNTSTITWTAAGNQSVSVNYIDINGCTAAASTIYPVTVNPLPVPTVSGPVSVCINAAGNIYSTQANMINYSWSLNGGGIITAGGSPTDNTITVTWNTIGPQIVSVIYTDTNNCTAASPSNYSVNVSPVPSPAGTISGPSTVCAGTQGILYSVPEIPNATSYTWILPLGVNIVSGQNTDSVTVDFAAAAVSGNITVYGVNDCGNGISSPPLTITVNHSAIASAGPDTTVCAGTIITTHQSAASDYTGLSWTTSGQGSLLNSTTLNPSYVPAVSDTGDVVLTLSAFAAPPCRDDTSVMVIHYAPGPIVNAGADQLTCVPIPVSITGAFALHCDSYSWTTAGQGQLSGANTLTPVYTPAAGDSGVVILTLHGYGSGACPFIITNDEARIMVYTALRSGSRHADTIEYNGIDTLSISVSGGSGNYRYTWTPGSLLLNDTAAVPITVNLTYGMLFTLSVQDRVTGCTATDSIFVYVKAPVSQENCIVVHNVVTPNGDGFNDRWLIDCIDQYPDNKVEIFNRWGERIRIYTNYNNVDQAWTGTGESGKSVPDGTYYYVIRIPGAETLTGWVLLKGGSK